MLLPDRGFAPATRAIELGNHRRTIIQADLIYPVLVTVQGEQPAADGKACFLERVHDHFRGKLIVGMCGRCQFRRLMLHKIQKAVLYRDFMDCR